MEAAPWLSTLFNRAPRISYLLLILSSLMFSSPITRASRYPRGRGRGTFLRQHKLNFFVSSKTIRSASSKTSYYLFNYLFTFLSVDDLVLPLQRDLTPEYLGTSAYGSNGSQANDTWKTCDDVAPKHVLVLFFIRPGAVLRVLPRKLTTPRSQQPP